MEVAAFGEVAHLAVVEGAKYGVETLSLASGDTILFYTYFEP